MFVLHKPRSIMSYLKSSYLIIRPGYARQLLIRTSVMYSTAEDKDVTKTSSAGQTRKQYGSLTDHHVNKLEKYILVWGGKYKTVAEVPELVSQTTMERARNKARIKINIGMAVATLVGCLLMVISGKKAQKEGDTLSKRSEAWHKKLKEESRHEAEMANTAK